MSSRRHFLITSVGASLSLTVNATAWAGNTVQHARAATATAITQVYGDGIRLIAIAVEFDKPVRTTDLSTAAFQVDERTVTGVFASTSADPGHRAEAGTYVIVTLSPDDAGAALVEPPQRKGDQGPAGDDHGPGPAGGPPVGGPETVYKPASARVVQTHAVTAVDGTVIAPGNEPLVTTHVRNLVVDDFRQLEFQDPKTGDTLNYNLFVPRNYDAGRSYPLVLFMHDAGATGSVTRTTLLQGLGAIAWASPADQAARPCFVLAPQYSGLIADDDSRTTSMLDTTIDLVKALADQYSIDRRRLYTTGQSGGCMMSIAMDIKYPEFFAASFLVAGQWDPRLVKPMARQKLWILVSQDDGKAFPGQDAITAVLEENGAKISRATWDGTWTNDQFRAAFEKIDAQASPINYVTFRKGTVIPPGQSTAGASGHRNTWRIAYTIEPIREWIFRQQGVPAAAPASAPLK